MKTITDIVRERIKKARLEAGYNQTELAKALGLSSNATISRYEKGDLNVSVELLYLIATLTNKPSSFFFETSEDIGSTEDIVRDYSALNETGQQRVLKYIKDMLKIYPR
ncbi:helix-turn-helix transcriptional regulator [bacterium]|nr:helix-turn-helix transcriptional regulator [bacterium]